MTERDEDLLFALLMGAAGSMVLGWSMMYVAICGALPLLPALAWIAAGVIPQMYCIYVVMIKGGKNADRSTETRKRKVR